MKTKKLFYSSTTLAAFFIAALVLVNTNYTKTATEYTKTAEQKVVSTSPSDGEMNVSRNTVIEIG
ncbi:MAG: hypothetical protein LAT67_12040 [Balneolales bacterium]|nr:hypothetical protein [Balneolales bacterium]